MYQIFNVSKDISKYIMFLFKERQIYYLSIMPDVYVIEEHTVAATLINS